MLTKDDLKAIKNLINSGLKPIKKRLDINTGSTMRMEEKIDKALELRIDAADLRKQVKDHEERMVNLERV